MTTLPQLLGTKLLTHSQRGCYKECPRKALHAYEYGVRRAEPGKALRVGSAIHHGLDLFAQGVERDAAIARATTVYDALPDWAVDDEKVAEWCEEREVVAALLAGYHWYWGPSAAEVVATEQVFNLPIRNPDTGAMSRTFRRAGKIDKVVRLADGRYAVREHKTTQEDIAPGADYWVRLGLDEQISEYVVAARALGHAIDTVEYDVIRKPGIRPRKLTAADLKLARMAGRYYGFVFEPFEEVPERESPAMYGARLLADITERPGYYYQRREIPRNDKDIAEYERDLWSVALQYANSRRTGRFYRNTGACVGRYGSCDYLRICADGIDPANPPAGFVRLTDSHPELQEAA